MSASLNYLLTKFRRVLESARSPFRKKYPTEHPNEQPRPRVSSSMSSPVDREELRTMLSDLLADPARQPELTRALRAALLGPMLPLVGGVATPAADVSAGQFGANTGWGNYSFPGSLGVGAANPAHKLHVQAPGELILALDSNPMDSTDRKWGLVVNPSWNTGSFHFYDFTGDSSRMAITASTGNVAIGVGAASLSKLGVSGGAAVGAGYVTTAAAPSNGLLVEGNVGIGTSSPKGIVDIAGRMVFLKPSGGDDTAQINSAISTLSSSGGVVYLSGGTYNVGNLQGASKVHLLGAGRGATILLYNGAIVGSSCWMIRFPAGSSNFSIRDITWDYALQAPPGGLNDIAPIVVESGCSNFKLSDCSLINLRQAASGVTTYGIVVVASHDFWIERNIIVQPNPNKWQQEAILLSSGNPSQPDMFNATIDANYLVGAGIDIFAYNSVVSNNVIEKVAYGGCIFTEDDSQDVKPDGSGWEVLRRCHDLRIVGNVIRDSVGPDEVPISPHGIENWARRSVISGNVCYHNNGNGIFNAGEDCIITENICYNNGQSGVAGDTAGISLGCTTLYFPLPPPNDIFGFVFSSSGSVVVGNRCFDDQGTKTQTFGIEDHAGLTCSTNVVIGVNNLRGNATGEMNILGSNYSVIATNATTGFVGIGLSGGTVADQKLHVGGDVHVNGIVFSDQSTQLTAFYANQPQPPLATERGGILCSFQNSALADGQNVNLYGGAGGTFVNNFMVAAGWLRSVAVALATAMQQGAVARLCPSKSADSSNMPLLDNVLTFKPNDQVGSYVKDVLVRYELGDFWSLFEQRLSTVAAATVAGVAAEFVQDDGGSILGSCGPRNSLTATSTNFIGFGGQYLDAPPTANELKSQIVAPFGGAVSGIQIRTSTSQPASGSMVVTLRKNGANTGVTATLTNGTGNGTPGVYYNPSVTTTFAQGDKLSIQAVNNASQVSAGLFDVLFSVTSSSLGATILCTGGNGSTLGAGLTRFLAFGTTNSPFSLTQAAAAAFPGPRAGSIGPFYVQTVNAQPGTGSLVLTILKNGAATSLIITVPAGAASGVYSSLGSVPIAKGDRICIQVVNNASAASSQLGGVSLAYI